MSSTPAHASAPSPAERYQPAVFLAAWAASAALAYHYLGRGWIPHDAGTLAQVSERVLQGELPHRDFVDVYTGGLAFLNALAFRVLGVSLMSMRLVLFAAFLAWIPAVWYVARRVVGPTTAALTTLVAAASSIPVYPEAMPSWYNLFFATWGVAALFRYLEVGGRVWLMLAGLAGGLSILFKIVGLYYVAGVLLFLIFLEDARCAGTGPGEPASDRLYRAFAAAACVAMAALALGVVVSSSDSIGLVYFAVPPLAAVTVVALRFRRPSGRSTGGRLRALVGLTVPVVGGVALPLAVFVVPFLLSGSIADLVRGVFVLPMMRLEFAAWDALPVVGFLPAAGLVVWVARASGHGGWRARALDAAVVALAVTAVGLSQIDIAYRVVWWTLTSLGPVVAVAGLVAVARDGRAGGMGVGREAEESARSGHVMLLLGVFGFGNLVQLPFAVPVYFFYAAPLLLLLAVSLVGHASRERGRALVFVLVLLLGFSVARFDRGFIYHLGFRYRPHNQTEAFEIERARGLRVTPWEKAEYEDLVRAVAGLDAGPEILALPDSPEVYFLTARRNPTRSLFDFFEESGDRDARLLRLVDERGISVVVLNRRPPFSTPIEEPLLDSLHARLNWTREIGRFLVLWRGPA